MGYGLIPLAVPGFTPSRRRLTRPPVRQVAGCRFELRRLALGCEPPARPSPWPRPKPPLLTTRPEAQGPGQRVTATHVPAVSLLRRLASAPFCGRCGLYIPPLRQPVKLISSHNYLFLMPIGEL